jgi:hypothetical protein
LIYHCVACRDSLSNIHVSFQQEFLATYLTGRKKNPHWFCKNCGSTLGTDLTWLMENILVDEEPRVTINLRMLKDIRISELKTERREGMRNM